MVPWSPRAVNVTGVALKPISLSIRLRPEMVAGAGIPWTNVERGFGQCRNNGERQQQKQLAEALDHFGISSCRHSVAGIGWAFESPSRGKTVRCKFNNGQVLTL